MWKILSIKWPRTFLNKKNINENSLFYLDENPYLINGMDDKNLENRIAAIKSSGMIGCSEATVKLHSKVDPVNDNQERLAAIISLGMLKNNSSIKILIKSLDDEEANIRWDSAISLFKMNDYSGNYILEKLLNREYYSNYSQVDMNEIDNAILTILALISTAYHEDFKDELVLLSNKEKNIKIREFAMKILAEYY